MRLAFAIFAFGCCSLLACGPPSAADEPSAEMRRIGEMHKSKCGSCHKLVVPGTRIRVALELALVRHRRRLKMSEADWSKMIDYLAMHDDAQLPRAPAEAPGPNAASPR